MPPKRKPKAPVMAPPIPKNTTLNGIFGKNDEYLVGDKLGSGGMGTIYFCSRKSEGTGKKATKFACKIEPIASGPLFCEQHFFLTMLREVKETASKSKSSPWSSMSPINYLPLPSYIAHGTLKFQGKVDLRFLIMPFYSGGDLQSFINKQPEKILPHKIQNRMSLQILSALDFMHNHALPKFSYIHADIKGLNILLDSDPSKDSCRAFLVDFGLVYKIATPGAAVYKPDHKMAGDGTIDYTSRDAHVGAKPAYRGDLEILLYCLIHWATNRLPWMPPIGAASLLTGPKEKVAALKETAMGNVDKFLKVCFDKSQNKASQPYPELLKLAKYVSQMEYSQQIDFKAVYKFFTDVKKFESDNKIVASSKSSSKKAASKQPAKPRGRTKKVVKEITSSEDDDTKSDVDSSTDEKEILITRKKINSNPKKTFSKPIPVKPIKNKINKKSTSKKSSSIVTSFKDTSLSRHDSSSSENCSELKDSRRRPTPDLKEIKCEFETTGTESGSLSSSQENLTTQVSKKPSPIPTQSPKPSKDAATPTPVNVRRSKRNRSETDSSEISTLSDKENKPGALGRAQRSSQQVASQEKKMRNLSPQPSKPKKASKSKISTRQNKNPVNSACQTTPGLKLNRPVKVRTK